MTGIKYCVELSEAAIMSISFIICFSITGLVIGYVMEKLGK